MQAQLGPTAGPLIGKLRRHGAVLTSALVVPGQTEMFSHGTAAAGGRRQEVGRGFGRRAQRAGQVCERGRTVLVVRSCIFSTIVCSRTQGNGIVQLAGAGC